MACFIGGILPEEMEEFGAFTRTIDPSADDAAFFKQYGNEIVSELRNSLNEVDVQLKSTGVKDGVYVVVYARVGSKDLFDAASKRRGGDLEFLNAEWIRLGNTLKTIMERNYDVKQIEMRNL